MIANKFCIRTRGPDNSKEIVETLVKLGYDDKFVAGTGYENTYYCINTEIDNCIRHNYFSKAEVIELSDLIKSNGMIYNFLVF